MSVRSYKDLLVWQKAILLVKEVYKVTRLLPKSEVFVLVPQMQRSALAIPSNIAEGFGRNHVKEFIQFLAIAFASSLELETQIIIVKQEYSHIDCLIVESLLVEVQKMIRGLKNSLLTPKN